MMPTVIAVLRHFGFKFSLDWDHELRIGVPELLDPQAIAEWLGTNHLAGIRAELLCRAAFARSHCVGGPFNGRRHGLAYPSVFALRVKRACWAGYAVAMYPDNRAMFAGLAASERKARMLAFKQQQTIDTRRNT